MKLCECGCGQGVKNQSSRFCQGHSNRSLEVKQKKIQTSLKNNGTEYPGQAKKVQEKMKRSFQKRYGVSHPMKSKEIRKKYEETLKKNYDVFVPAKSEKIQEKTKQTCIERYGVECPYQLERVREKGKITCVKNWGAENPSQSKEINDKKIQSHQKHCGFDHWSKSPQGRLSNRIKAIRETEIRFLNNEPIMPNVGTVERECLNELERISNLKIVRQTPIFRYVIGRIPDGYISSLNLIILYDERREHFLDQECSVYNDESILTSQDYHSFGLFIIRISEWNWKENKQEVVENFLCVIKGLEDIKRLQDPSIS